MTYGRALKSALLSASALCLVACSEEKEEALAYASVEACIKAGIHDSETCQAEFEKAEQRHTEVAPRYTGANSCYTDYGHQRCSQYRSSGGSFWLPYMVGYMMAPRGSMLVYTQPLYRPNNDPGNFYTAGNSRIGSVSANGRTQVSRSKVSRPSPARTRTVSRGGFGSRAVSASS